MFGNGDLHPPLLPRQQARKEQLLFDGWIDVTTFSDLSEGNVVFIKDNRKATIDSDGKISMTEITF